MSNSLFVRLAAIGILAMSLTLSACGRRGPLDAPPRAAVQPADQQQAAPAPAGQPQQEAAVRQAPMGWPFGQSDDIDAGSAPKPPKKTFFMDWLLN